VSLGFIDDHGEIVEGTFYAEELQKVIKTDDVYKIEPILKKINILPHLGTIPRPKGFPIEGKKHMKELRNKFDMGFNEINHKIDKQNRANFLPEIECDSAKPNVRSRKDIYPTGLKNCLR
jgi:hypothetical protein